MPDALPLPMRVLVKGPSTTSFISWMGGPRTDLATPRVIEQQLLAAGRPCETRVLSMANERANRLVRTWPTEVLAYSPDVIVLQFGTAEAMHLVIPRWLERHAHSERTRRGPVRRFYRGRIVKPAWRVLWKAQQLIDRRIPVPWWRPRARCIANDIAAYAGHVQTVGSPLVLVLGLWRPSGVFAHVFPGFVPRVDMLNEETRAAVEDLDLPNVRYVPTAPVVEAARALTDDGTIGDGIHLTPALHAEVGAMVAEIIGEWADTQPHLKIEGSSATP